MKTISRVSTVSILFACFLGLWSTRNHRYIVAAQQPSDVSITRIFTSSDGQTHAEEVHENLTAVAGRTGLEQSRSIRATGITFVRRAPGLTENWHTAPRPTGVILVAGVDWAFDLRGICIQEPNIVYSAHIYVDRSRRHWHQALGNGARVPILVGEWGGTEQDLHFGRVLTSHMRRLGLGWTAWSWADEPRLVKPGSYDGTPFGELVRNELRAP